MLAGMDAAWAGLAFHEDLPPLPQTKTTAANWRERRTLTQQWLMELKRENAAPTGRGMLRFQKLSKASRPSAALCEEMDLLIKVLHVADRHTSELGVLSVRKPSILICGADQEVHVEFRVGPLGMPQGALLRFGQPFTSDWGRPQSRNPGGANYLTASATGQAGLRVETVRYPKQKGYGPMNWGWTSVTVAQGSLKQGDSIHIVFGDRSGGGPGQRIQTFTADTFGVYTEVSYLDTGLMLPLPYPACQIQGGALRRVDVVAPARIRQGAHFAVRVIGRDRFHNSATPVAMHLSLTIMDERGNMASLGGIELPGDRFPPVARMDGVLLKKPGIYRLRATTPDGSLLGESAPVQVIPDASGEPYLYWGDIHGHSHLSDGYRDAASWYTYARDEAFLDLAALTDHGFNISRREWQEIQEGNRLFLEEGRFVTILAYEWTMGKFALGGHHNVYYRDAHGPMLDIKAAGDVNALYDMLERRVPMDRVLVIPHVGGGTANWNYHNPAMEKLVEIYSAHGSFEWFGKHYLAKGARVGFVAASDDHTGSPGNAPAVWSVRGGLVGVYAPTLDRPSIFTALQQRHVYATTGARILLEVKTSGGAVMGDHIDGPLRGLAVQVEGSDVLETIDIVKNGEVVHTEDLRTQGATMNQVSYCLLFTESCENFRNPRALKQRQWLGEIALQAGRMTAVTPTGFDSYRDKAALLDNGTVSFRLLTQGDQDGLILTMDGEPVQDTMLSVRLRAHTLTFPLRDLGVVPVVQTSGNRGGTVSLRRLTHAGVMHHRFVWKNMKPTEGEAANYYVRVSQRDGEQAWSSPIFVRN